ncbi:MAG: hypothetical protein PHO32_02570 [Candidatus Cloacimonetes bacterium]|nr:hypothetical protein [Candidatus Cloacimonadota bacterium]
MKTKLQAEIVKIVTKSITLFALIILADYLISNGIDYILRKNQSGYYEFKQVVETKPEIVILGASRASCHYVSTKVAKGTGRSVYNFGVGGTSVLVQYTQLQEILSVYKPKLIVYEICGSDFSQYFVMDSSIRYLKMFPLTVETKRAFKETDKYFVYKNIFKLYKYNNDVLGLIVGRSKTNVYNLGYAPNPTAYLPLILQTNKSYVSDTQSASNSALLQQTFCKLLQLTEQLKIPIVFLRSPYYHPKDSNINLRVDPIVLKGIEKHNKSLIDFSSMSIPAFENPGNYKDYIHLTDKGANMYTDIIVPYLNKFIDQQIIDDK